MNSINDQYHAGIMVKNIYVNILDCIIKYNDCGVRLTRTKTLEITNCNISNCEIRNNFGLSIYIISASHININHCERNKNEIHL